MSTLSARLTTLPRPLSSFIGREEEIRAVCELFMSGVRLATLIGPGGVGKTRLALAIIGQLEDGFDGEIAFVSLAPVVHHRLVIPTVAGTLAVDESADQSILEHLAAYLRDRRTAIILDNVEHVLEAGPDITWLLQQCPELIVLATGREPLRLQGEYEFEVEPLRLSGGGAAGSTESESPAVQLFAERARQAYREFDLTDENAAIVREICRRLDGLPLALELAAARLKMLSPADLLAKLDEPLSVLTGGPRDAPDRQRTMRATLQWSYDLLSPNEQRLLRQMAVFAGGATFDVIEAVSSAESIFETLGSLVDKSLVHRASEGDELPRYDMLEPVRQFAVERLEECGDEARKTRQLHAECLLSNVEGLKARLNGPDAPAWFARMELEHDNHRAAMRWLRETGQVDLGQRFVANLAIFWTQRHIDEGRSHATTFLNSPGTSRRTLSRARALWSASWLWLIRDDVETALPMVEEARSIAEEHGDRYTWAHAITVRGTCRLQRDDDEGAQADIKRALPVFREQGSDVEAKAMVVRGLFHLARIARRRGDIDGFRAFAEEALAVARSSELKMVLAGALLFSGQAAEQLEDYQLAFERYEEHLMLSYELDIPYYLAESLVHIALFAARHKQFDRAACLMSAATVQHKRGGTLNFSIRGEIDIDSELDELRSALPASAFQIAWDRGSAMTVEEAIELALQGFDTRSSNAAPAPPDDLTPREVEVLALMAGGRSNREMADDLYLSIRTVERHISNIYRKIDAHNRTDATRYALQHNIIELANT